MTRSRLCGGRAEESNGQSLCNGEAGSLLFDKSQRLNAPMRLWAQRTECRLLQAPLWTKHPIYPLLWMTRRLRTQSKGRRRVIAVLALAETAAPDVWYYADEKGRVGPLSLEELKNTLTALPNTNDVLVWCQHLSDWKRVRDVPVVMPHMPELAVPKQAPDVVEPQAQPLAPRPVGDALEVGGQAAPPVLPAIAHPAAATNRSTGSEDEEAHAVPGKVSNAADAGEVTPNSAQAARETRGDGATKSTVKWWWPIVVLLFPGSVGRLVVGR